MHGLKLAPRARTESDILDHMLIRLSSVKAQSDPFPHFFVEDVFPADVYQQLLQGQPASEQMRPLAEKHSDKDGKCHRFQLDLNSTNIESIPLEHRHVWQATQRALAAPQLQQAVFSKLQEGLCYRFGVKPNQVGSISAHPFSCLMRETAGYTIPPHPDGRRKIVTMQFALPADHSQEDLGTTFYERSMHPRDWATQPRGFRHAKQMPFRPNCAYAFVVLNTWAKKSWHGREIFTGDRGTRNSILHLYRRHAEGGSDY